MRSIDADRLCEELKARRRAALNWKEGAILAHNEESMIRADAVLAFLSEVKLTIDNAPTVERPQGEWIKEDDEHLKGWYRCSECGRRVEDLTDDVVIHAGCEDYTIADIYPYCHCGAKMTGGGKE